MGRSRVRLERSSLTAVIGTVGVLVVLAMGFVDLDGWATRLQESFDTGPAVLSRTRIWQETLPIVRDFWLTGTGAGTYSEAMTQYQQSRVWVGSMQRWAHFNNAHSHYLQVMSEGGLLLVSQFTLFASLRKGNKPSWHRAAIAEAAIPLYEAMIARLTTLLGRPVATGRFGAMMQVALANDGPVTLLLDSKTRE